MVPHIVGAVLETVAFMRLAPHYGTNLVVALNDSVKGLEGCGGQSFALAQTLLSKPIIYERSIGMYISLILGWLMLIAIMNYYFVYRKLL